jgi:hypothetical protein
LSGAGINRERTEQASLSGRAAPNIKFDKTVHDFGEVVSNKKYTGRFEITNAGNRLLRITKVKPCCGVRATLSKDEFEPGESGVLKVEYNSGKSSGVVIRQIQVSSNDKSNPEITLTLKAKVAPKVAHKPHRLQLVIDEENAGSPNIEIASLDNQPFSLRSFQSTGGSITADIDQSVEATKFVLRPQVDLEKLQKHPAGFVSVELTHPECERVDIYFNTLLRFDITPRSVMIFNPQPRKPVVKKITVASNYGEDFEIESVSSRNGLAKIISRQKTAKGYQFDVEITPPPVDETEKITDVIYLELDDGEKLAIDCYVRYLS